MTKEVFLRELARHLEVLTEEERTEALNYYREYIEEGVEAGRTEEEVVASLDPPETIAAQMRMDSAFARAAKRPTPKNTTKALLAVFGILSLPIALPLALVVIAVAFCVLAAAFAVMVSIACAILGIVFAMIIFGIRAIMALTGGLVSGVSALFTVGTALIGLALTVLAVILLIRFGYAVIHGVGWFFRWLSLKLRSYGKRQK